MRYWGYGHMGDGWGIAAMLTMVAFWVLLLTAVVLAVVWAVRAGRGQAAPHAPTSASPRGVTDGAEQVLAERLARGEIDPEEYRARLDALRSSRGHP